MSSLTLWFDPIELNQGKKEEKEQKSEFTTDLYRKEFDTDQQKYLRSFERIRRKNSSVKNFKSLNLIQK